ncbi:hypothetical protein QAD02_010204 [Eretmocerus hayati]|uniref:Uncharacterized protein n=1 Tax=Eretmocerus hayati TaxID=131215 RepID=A0ACC2NBV3_9HYME|nr:hypothetical protein QAD02_010204 [Eretmocerus hayati]
MQNGLPPSRALKNCSSSSSIRVVTFYFAHSTTDHRHKAGSSQQPEGASLTTGLGRECCTRTAKSSTVASRSKAKPDTLPSALTTGINRDLAQRGGRPNSSAGEPSNFYVHGVLGVWKQIRDTSNSEDASPRNT